jgi:hypothetical protein
VLAGEEVVERAAEAVDVRPRAGVPRRQRLLGSHVRHGPHHFARVRQAGRLAAVGCFGAGERERLAEAHQPEVEDLDRAGGVEQQVGRLDVAVDHAFLVGVGQPAGRLHDIADRPLHRQRPFLTHQPGEVTPLDVLHDEEVDAIVLARVVRRDDVRVAQAGHGLGLVLEALQPARVSPARLGKDFEGHAPAQRQLLGLVDDPHAAAADLADDAVVAHGIAQTQIGVGRYQGRRSACPGDLGGRQRGEGLAKQVGQLRVDSRVSVEVRQRGQHLAQDRRQLGVGAGVLLHVRLFAPLGARGELAGEPAEQRLLGGIETGRRIHGAGRGSSPSFGALGDAPIIAGRRRRASARKKAARACNKPGHSTLGYSGSYETQQPQPSNSEV